MSVIAVVFDFDDTLLPDSTSQLLQSHGIDPDPFWRVDAKGLIDAGYDPPLAYLNLMLDRVGRGRPLGELTNQALREFGSSLDATYFAGLPALFTELRELVSTYRDMEIEFYIVSGGLQEVMAGSAVVRENFTAFYGCQLGEDSDTGLLRYVKRCVTFTEKTRFLFEINKGVDPEESRTQPHLVNRYVDESARRVPMDQMIYVGDGLTDVPCFSLVNRYGGTTFGVFKRGAESAKQAFQQFLQTDRVKSLYSPDYREEADLGAMVRAAVATHASQIMLRRERAV